MVSTTYLVWITHIIVEIVNSVHQKENVVSIIIDKAAIYPKENKNNDNIYIVISIGERKNYPHQYSFTNPKLKFQNALGNKGRKN